jgi:F0F1-type ATP synthase assembly protein I
MIGTRWLSGSAQSNKALQDNLDRSEPRIIASYALVGAILLFGGIGFAADWWAGSAPWFVLLGLLIGTVLGFWNLLRDLPRTRSREGH